MMKTASPATNRSKLETLSSRVTHHKTEMCINYLVLSAEERCSEQNAIWTCQNCGKMFADSGGWRWPAFKYDTASDTFTPATRADQPPQGNDAKCGLAWLTIAKTRDYVFTDYQRR